jgi:hypothetical protein
MQWGITRSWYSRAGKSGGYGTMRSGIRGDGMASTLGLICHVYDINWGSILARLWRDEQDKSNFLQPLFILFKKLSFPIQAKLNYS